MLDEQTDYLDNRHARAKHLLWGLVIIKVYGNEKAMCAIVSIACLFLLSLAESLVYRQTVESDRILASSAKVGRRLFTMTVKLDASCTRASRLLVVAEKGFSPKSQILTKKRMTARLSVASSRRRNHHNAQRIA
jgi:type II secretory pathway component PulJ